jgi:uncharacterized protein YyaL (SSP411 family)
LEKTLYNYRNREKTLLDDKCLTSWNAILLKGFVDAFKTFGDEKHKEIALKNGEFIQKNCWDNDGFLYRNFKNGKNSIVGYLEDYAHVIDAFISLYEITLMKTGCSMPNNSHTIALIIITTKNNSFSPLTTKMTASLLLNIMRLKTT